MSRLYCPTCRLLSSRRDLGPPPSRCPRCEASIRARAIEEKAWLLAELRASRSKDETGPTARRAPPARAAP